MCKAISLLAKSWRDEAETRITAATEPEHASLYRRSFIVNRICRNVAKNESSFSYHFSVVIDLGLDLHIRGFALLRLIEFPLIAYKHRQPLLKPDPNKTFIRIVYLSTDPHNLLGELGYKGTGTNLVQFVFDKCIRGRFAGVFVEPVIEARSFFTKFGFIDHPDPKAPNGMLWQPRPQSASAPSSS